MLIVSNRERGAALIIVLFIAAILASMAALMIIKTKQHVERITIAKDYMQAERKLISDISEFIFITQTTPYAILGDNTDFHQFSTLPNNINLQGIPFTFQNSEITLQDMGGLIPILPFDLRQFTRYLEGLNWPQNQISPFIDVMEDWQDTDGFKRINGAESFDYNVFGYPLNQPLQTIKDVGLFANIDSHYLDSLINNNHVILFGAGAVTPGYAPDELLSVFNSEFDAELIKKERDSTRLKQDIPSSNNYPTGNWIIKVNTSYGLAKSSRVLHLVRRFGEHRAFVISRVDN